MKYIFCGRLNTINQHRCVTHFCAGNAIQPICELLPAVECAVKRITLDGAKKTVRLRTASVPKTNSKHRCQGENALIINNL